MNEQRFLKACRREPVRPTPVWFMRQAGRYLPQYRRVRERLSLWEILERPELCAEITVQPVELLGVDAAILFSDISVAFRALGVAFELREQLGPVPSRPVRTAADVDRLRPVRLEETLALVGESARLAARALRVPLIGFAGGPFTLASYLVEGGPSRRYLHTKALMYSDPGLWRALMERLARVSAALLAEQVRCGARAVQVFDSWAGALSREDFEEFVAPHLRWLFGQLASAEVPTIYFAVETGGYLESLASLGASVVGVDWRVPLDQAWRRLGFGVGIQGNLDPAALLAPRELLARRATAVLEQAAGRPGHIFNLGHGVPPEADPQQVRFLVELVRETTSRGEPAAPKRPPHPPQGKEQ
ncbi:MAG TPA: uroporphyrinogen decarboxylase [Limnochordales bacterium]